MSKKAYDAQMTKEQKLELLLAKKELREGLPHLYGWKNYPWMGDFLETTNKTALLTAANQIGKSSSQIRKVIDWATDVSRWPSLWKTTPRQFWYLYPTREVASIEFETKWKPDFMPRGKFKDHPQYGWREEKRGRGEIFAVHFNSGVSIYFKTYAQDVQHLQSSSVYYVACDEELPYELWGEINFRRNAVDGYFSMVFTATLGQDEWRRAMEPQRGEDELLKGAWKKQVSLFDCQTYTDGTQSHWTDEKIQRTIALCGTDKEVLKRIYGKFVLSEGLKYSSFARSHNVIAPRAVPDNFHIFAGVDIGVGGDKNHPSTITFVAVSPRFDMGYVFKHWRGDDKIYTMSDVANKYIELREDLQITAAFYDYHARDFKTITDRMGMSFQMADKRHDVGEQIINTLFKNRMLFIFDTIENEPIMRELTSVMLNVDKRKLKDDSVDSLRYAITRIPWDWSKVGLNMNVKIQPLKQETEEQRSIRERNSDAQRMRDEALTRSQVSEIEQELEEWGSYLE